MEAAVNNEPPAKGEGTSEDQTHRISTPSLSVIVLNYNGIAWIRRCLETVFAQVVPGGLEVIVADNASRDGSDIEAESLVAGSTIGRFVQNGANLGFCEGNNAAARLARGDFLLFLNNDTWLEPNCLATLLAETIRVGAEAATPLILNYDSDVYQGIFGEGFDICGYPSFGKAGDTTRDILMPPGCSFLIRRELFLKIGEFDPEIFMYGDEFDLSWRIWIAGSRAVAVPAARLHHRGAPTANPAGGESFVEARTTEGKRYLANRNSLLVILKNAQHMLLLLIGFQLCIAFCESLVGAILAKRIRFFVHTWLYAVRDCWRLRRHIATERVRINALRRRGDLWLLRFYRLRLNRWDEYRRFAKLGVPKIS